MGALIRAKAWSSTPFGPIESWPQSLRSAVSILLPSKAQIVLFWGPELVAIYNDAYRPAFGSKHPAALGMPAHECWSEVWDVLEPLFQSVVSTGEAFWAKDHLFELERHGYVEETYFDVSYDPVRDETGRVGGIFCIVSETTGRIIGERRLGALRDLGRIGNGAASLGEVFRNAAAVLDGYEKDVPFAAFYSWDAGHGVASLEATTGLESGGALAPDQIETANRGDAWPVGRDTQMVLVEASRGLTLSGGAWPEAVKQAAVLKVATPGYEPYGYLVAGISARRKFDNDYGDYFRLLSSNIANASAGVRALEDERRRAEALAELDQAKTAFFSNVSHEFRTPLTLMLGPLEDLLARTETDEVSEDRALLMAARRNGQRLLKLVNTLLDFARIEAGRAQASYQLTDLPVLTAELASNFRSACERAGIRLAVDCPPLAEPTYVDRDMWEKIVLNLLSNAFKYTLAGLIEVSLHVIPDARCVELTIRDTGCGIPEAELPRIFERFHRVAGQGGRTQEGTGIGLSLVQELVKMHGGTVRVLSEPDKGTSFFVRIPTGLAHLPVERIAAKPSKVSAATSADAFVEEALRWLPEPAHKMPEGIADVAETGSFAINRSGAADDIPRILLADDNVDLRQYISRLLSLRYVVEVVADGEAALHSARVRRPDLVLTDVMMPKLDGFGLLAALRTDPTLRDLPVILLSARAGEEAIREGRSAGADDYLVKPFSARELVARVDGSIRVARARRQTLEALQQSERRFRQVADNAPVMIWMADENAYSTYLNRRWYEFTGQTPDEAQGLGWLETAHPEDKARVHDLYMQANAARTAFQIEYRLRRADGMYRWAIDAASPHIDEEGRFAGYIGSVVEIHERREAEEFLRTMNEQLEDRVAERTAELLTAEELLRQAQKMEAVGQLTGGIAHDFNNLLTVVIGNVDSLQRHLPEHSSDRVRRATDNALLGAKRAASLTQRLLAFARRQPLDPKPVDVSKLVSGMSDLLTRTLGERIEVQTVFGAGLWRVEVDPNQLESALLNLALNARDAMPEGGQLTIETANAHLDEVYAARASELAPGQYVVVAVSDTGMGMTRETLDHVFEPFFTTKPIGQGTGLGLSQVYGFVKQSGGHVKLYSEVGEGTTVRIYLPRLLAGTNDNEPVRSAVAPDGQSNETVLVVEDEPAVREYSCDILRELGYRVLEAGDGEGALRLLERHRDIAVLFTDLGLPGMPGRELADHARRFRPKLKVLFTTAYARNAIVHHGRLDGGVQLLGKPFTYADLAAKIRDLIDHG